MAQERHSPGRSPIRALTAAMLLAAATLTGGCGSQEATPTTTVRSTASTSPEGKATGSLDTLLKPLIDVAVADLVSRLRVEAASVSVVSAKPMQWPDRSLGCPQPGMAYPQTPVDGARIELSVAGTTYRYHSGGSRGPFLCENATS